MKQIARLFIIALSALLSHQESVAQIDPVLAARLQVIIDSVRVAQNLRGVSAAVIIPSSVPNSGLWRGVGGLSHGSVPITPGMKFCIASNTKLFISTLMLKLQEMNVLSLEDSLHRWIPTFPNVNPNITIRQLLNHTSGVYNYVEHSGYAPAMNADTGRFWAPESILTNFVNSPYCSPGGCWHYSNTNYTLAGMVIRAATSATVSQKLRQLILTAFNLNSTYFLLEESVPDTIAHGWANFQEYAYPYTSWTSALSCAGNMYGTASDQARWYDSLFSGRILSPASMNQMLTFVPTTETYRYGLGIMRIVVGERTKYQHDGSMQKGYRSLVRIDSTSRYIIAVLNNHAAANPFEYVNALDNAIRNWWPRPSQVNLIAPAHEQIVNADSVTCTWSSTMPTATQYWFERAADSLFSAGLLIDSTLTDTAFTTRGLPSSSTYWWRVKARNASGWGEYSVPRSFRVVLVGINEEHGLPNVFELKQNYPNPFNPDTRIAYNIGNRESVSLKVYDLLGREVATLVNAVKQPGSYEVTWDATVFASGVYFYRLQSGSFVETKRLVVLK